MARATNPEQLVNLLNRVWPDHKTEKGGREHMVLCPFCDSEKPKCAVNPDKGVFQCWVCGERGPTLKLLYHLFNLHLISQSDIDAVRSGNVVADLSSTIQSYKGSHKPPKELWTTTIPCVFPPKVYNISEFNPHNVFEARLLKGVKKYLYSRGMDDNDIKDYRLHFCCKLDSPYYGHIFFPALGEFGKQLVFWTTRSILPNPNPKSMHASHKYARFSAKQIIFNQHLVRSPVALCEGPFDAFSIMKVTGIPAIPLLGKQLHAYTRSYLREQNISEVYVCLDPDARKEQMSIAQVLVPEKIDVLFVDLEEGDPNSIAPEKLYAAFKNAAYRAADELSDLCSTF